MITPLQKKYFWITKNANFFKTTNQKKIFNTEHYLITAPEVLSHDYRLFKIKENMIFIDQYFYNWKKIKSTPKIKQLSINPINIVVGGKNACDAKSACFLTIITSGEDPDSAIFNLLDPVLLSSCPWLLIHWKNCLFSLKI